MILVFGKTGQVAKELQFRENIITLERNQVDLSNPSSCLIAILNYKPEAVINAAAYTNVDKAEENEALATIINSDAPKAMAIACSKLNIPFIHISTDYVFDGRGDIPWRVQDLTTPQNAYGRSKLSGEISIRNSGATYAIIRTSWIISSHRSNFVKTMLRLSETRDKIKVVSDQIGGPTYARDIAQVCLQIASELRSDPIKSGIYHYSGTPNVSWAELASEIFNQAGKDTKVEYIYTSDFPMNAKRPLNSRLNCDTIKQTFCINQPKWKRGLENILKELKVK